MKDKGTNYTPRCGAAKPLLLLLKLRALQLLPLLLLSCRPAGRSVKAWLPCCAVQQLRDDRQLRKVQAVLTDIWPMRHAS